MYLELLLSDLPRDGDYLYKLKDIETLLIFIQFGLKANTLPKAQQTGWLSSAYQSNLFRSYHKFKHKS